MISYITIASCFFALASSRNVPGLVPSPYEYERVRNEQNSQYNPYWNKGYRELEFTYPGDINMEPNYEVNVDHQKYIPTIEGRPIYIPPIVKFDSKRRVSMKQYPKDTRPWHYWHDTPMPKYGYVDEKQYDDINRLESIIPSYSKAGINPYRNYQMSDPEIKEREEINVVPVPERNENPGFYSESEYKNPEKLKYEQSYEENDQYPHEQNFPNKAEENDQYPHEQNFPNKAKTYINENSNPEQDEYNVAYNDKIGDLLPNDYERNVDTGTSNKHDLKYPKLNQKSKVKEHNYGSKNVLYNKDASTPQRTEKEYVKSSQKPQSYETSTNSYEPQSSGNEDSESIGSSTPKDLGKSEPEINLPDVDYSQIQERNKQDESDLDESVDLEQAEAKKEFLNKIDSKFRSLVFNPSAKSTDKFQSCVTPKNESGTCRYVQHCLLPNIIGAIGQFMNYVCIIQDRFIGVCCAEFPVTSIKVKWEGIDSEASNTENSTVITPEECGVSSRTRIIGGAKANPKDYPWMAALQTMSKGQFFCGGALINNRYVLTAAHCTFGIPRDQILIRLGEYDFSDTEGSLGEDYPVIEIKRHGQYSRRTLENDIALLKLARPVTFANHIKTICLPENKTFEETNATLAGWGNTKGGGSSSNVLLEITIPVVDNKKCADTHGLPVSKNAICTMATPHDKGACNGDSGGPLMVLDDDSKHWYVLGVVSWGRRGCDPKFPTVYAGVSNYIDWIKTHAV